MADITPTPVAIAGVVDTTVTPTATTGDTFTNTGKEFIEVSNGSGSSITVTVDAYPSGGQTAPGGLVVTDPAISVAAGARKKIGPFPKSIYNNNLAKVKVVCSAVSSVTLGVYSLTPTT